MPYFINTYTAGGDTMKIFYLVAILLVTSLAVIGDPACPSYCTCNKIGYSGNSAKCSAFDSTQRFELDIAALDLSDITEAPGLQLTDRIFLNANLKQLSSIKIVNSSLKTIDVNAFHGLRDLSSLNLTGNHLSLLEPDMFKSNIHLTMLSLSQNPLQYMQEDPSPYSEYFLNIPSLQELDLSMCYISHLLPTMFTKLSGLTYINLAYNNIENISSETFGPLLDLEELDLSHNKLQYLRPDTFQNNTELLYLRLQNNPLSTLADLYVPDIQALDISQCHFKTINNDTFSRFLHLKNLNLSGNALTNLPSDTFSPLKKLQYLDLSTNNLMGQLPDDLFINNIQLEILKLQNNPGLELPETGFQGEFTEMYLLDVSNCGLTHLEVDSLKGMKHLSFLNLAHNEIQYLKPGVLPPRVEYLDLSWNNIAHLDQIHFSASSSLRQLSLTGNPLKKLSPNDFVNTPRLAKLYLNSCSLKKIWDLSSNKTQPMKSITYLNMADNQIKTLTMNDLSYIERVQTLILTNNPLTCDDKVNESIQYLIDNGVASSDATAKKRLEEIRHNRDVIVDPNSEKDQSGWNTLLSKICENMPEHKQEHKFNPTYEIDPYYENATDYDEEMDGYDVDITEPNMWDTETWKIPAGEVQREPLEQSRTNYMWPIIIVSLSAFAIILALMILAAFFLRWNRQKNSYRNKILKRHSLCGTPRVKRGWSSVYQQLYEDPTTTPTTPIMPTKLANEQSEQKTYTFPEKNSQEGSHESAAQTNTNTSYLSSPFHHSNIVPESV
ncbi:hypothetical protein C0J52_04108 [Blattella germanica]|nr:hypothetical protein C0J52_04108 [Blattella germanica]